MTATIRIRGNGVWRKYSLYNSINFDERLDEQLDSGGVQVITDSQEPFEDFFSAYLSIFDGTRTKETYFVGFDTVEKRGEGYYIHNLDLVEPTRLLMGVMIDGRKVTQSIGDVKKSLYDVLEGLLSAFELLPYNGKSRFKMPTDPDIIGLLYDTISPEFHWEAQTLLWECLCDIGNVINCIPRLGFDYAGADYDKITFDKINEVTKVYEL